jgi:hypothetical protein
MRTKQVSIGRKRFAAARKIAVETEIPFDTDQLENEMNARIEKDYPHHAHVEIEASRGNPRSLTITYPDQMIAGFSPKEKDFLAILQAIEDEVIEALHQKRMQGLAKGQE